MRKKPADKRWQVFPVRLDPALIKRIDKYVERQERTGVFVTRSDVMRAAIVKMLDEKEGGT